MTSSRAQLVIAVGILLQIGCGQPTDEPPAVGAGGAGSGGEPNGGDGGRVEGGAADSTEAGGAGSAALGGVMVTGGSAAGSGGAAAETQACAAWCSILVPPCYAASQIAQCKSHCASTIADQRTKGCDDEYLAAVRCFGTLTAADYACSGTPATAALKPGFCALEQSNFAACQG